MSPEEIKEAADWVKDRLEHKPDESYVLVSRYCLQSILEAQQTLQVQLEDARQDARDARQDAMDARADAADDVWNAAIRLVRR